MKIRFKPGPITRAACAPTDRGFARVCVRYKKVRGKRKCAEFRRRRRCRPAKRKRSKKRSKR